MNMKKECRICRLVCIHYLELWICKFSLPPPSLSLFHIYFFIAFIICPNTFPPKTIFCSFLNESNYGWHCSPPVCQQKNFRRDTVLQLKMSMLLDALNAHWVIVLHLQLIWKSRMVCINYLELWIGKSSLPSLSLSDIYFFIAFIICPNTFLPKTILCSFLNESKYQKLCTTFVRT